MTQLTFLTLDRPAKKPFSYYCVDGVCRPSRSLVPQLRAKRRTSAQFVAEVERLPEFRRPVLPLVELPPGEEQLEFSIEISLNFEHNTTRYGRENKRELVRVGLAPARNEIPLPGTIISNPLYSETLIFEGDS